MDLRPTRARPGLVALTVLLALGAAPGSPAVADAAPTGHLMGTVTGPSGAGIDVAEVFAYHLHEGRWEQIAYDGNTPGGSYDIQGLGAGTYRLCFVDPSGATVAECWDDVADVASATDVVLAEGATAVRDARLAAPAAPAPPVVATTLPGCAPAQAQAGVARARVKAATRKVRRLRQADASPRRVARATKTLERSRTALAAARAASAQAC